MVRIGNQCGIIGRALLTNMDAPLGRAAGNWLEVKEAVACLRSDSVGTRSAASHSAQEPGNALERVPADLRDLVLACAAHLLVQTGRAKSLEGARQQAEDCLSSGQPLQKWNEMLVAQGADLDALHRKLALDHTPSATLELTAPQSGFIS